MVKGHYKGILPKPKEVKIKNDDGVLTVVQPTVLFLAQQM